MFGERTDIKDKVATEALNFTWRKWGANHVGIWGKSNPGRAHSKYKGSEVGACLVCLQNSKGQDGWSRVSKMEKYRRDAREAAHGYTE